MARRQEFAVIGLGRFGSSLALTLEEYGHSVLGIDFNSDIVQHISEHITQAVSLDSTNEEALKAVDIGAFETVIVAIGSDFENNLLTTVALKALGVKQVICKAPTDRQKDILLRIGADQVVQPEFQAGQRLAEQLISPTILDKLDLGAEHSLAELVVPSSMTWKTLEQLDIRNKYGVTILVIKREEEVFVTPRADFILHPEDIVVVIGRNARIGSFTSLT